MRTDDLDYELPASAIAQVPAEPRDAARLLVEHGPGRALEHRRVCELPSLVGPGDVVVVNDTRVRRARLRCRRATGGRVEVLLVTELGAGRWEALVRPGRRIRDGDVLRAEDGAVNVTVVADLGHGLRAVALDGDPETVGDVPLPPYIHEPLADAERYQTVYARRLGSAAAPTAGLHLTPGVLEGCRRAGAVVVAVELVVGLDTFQPIIGSDVDDHVIHTEAYSVPESTWEACLAAERVLAVGTTAVRALESVASTGALEGRTALFIRPGYHFEVVDRLLTNFHVPRTSLLALVASFVGDRWRELYAEAMAEGYRFLSFGDAMLLERSTS
ncbi:MAG: tRNA preQ1(34) S-adenosylmethionine ribosyltransferase-isomerase QueA [Acidimicrobiales bacterium]